MTQKLLSTTALAKEMGIQAKELFQTLTDADCIKRENDGWVLTDKGREFGGTLKTHPQHGTYIAWDEQIKTILATDDESDNSGKLISAVTLSKHFNISRFRMNPILSELGWVQKAVKGWTVTKLGESIGGKQFEYAKTGIPYVCWEESILTNKRLLETIQSVQGVSVVETEEASTEEKVDVSKPAAIGFREKFEAKHRTADGHYVRSRAEMLIDNWLYMSEIVHAYERKLPIEEDVYCDFYLPVGKVYIEYWGMENDKRYVERKNEKLRIYNKYGFNLIELEDADIQNLDDILPKKLLKFGIQAY
ncbi:glycerol kinase [Paenibacillus methanolicus]|uniref:Glycerol kinase n=1 Tax=Paenibacillus methanolicus TaxID=582686 RepID=A0A5S5BTL3_9BACL|nr:glycerol kinase [Paenibacillus methanolicus]TYP69636.1 hypothetical protein BCM02_114153 [Paenibacillus methanolicus]